MFHFHPRDGMILAATINDKYAFRGERPPFKYINLTELAKHFGVAQETAHHAYYDCLAEIDVYRNLLQFD